MWHRNTGILRPDSSHRGDIVTDCMVDLLAEGGFSAVTLRTLAARVGVTSSALIRWFGSTDQMWEVIAARYGQRWMDLLQDRGRPYRPHPLRPAWATHLLHGLLPGTDDEVVWTRVWLALVEIGRHRTRVGVVIDGVEEDERAWTRWALEESAGPEHVDAVVALVRGLRHTICAPERPIPVRRAHAVLARHLRS